MCSIRPAISWFGFLAIWLIAPAVCADFVIYTLPGSRKHLLLEGRAKMVGNGVIEYTHPTLGTLVMSQDNATIIKAPTKQEDFKRLFAKANKSKNIEDFLEAARQAIKKGLLKEFYECCSAAYKVDPTNTRVKRLIEARKLIKSKLPDTAETEAKLRQIVDRPNMRIKSSDHYIMLHDTSDAKVGKKRQTRAETRLELLETVYESYFMKFALDGIVLEPPKEKMMILLFGEESDYLHYSIQLDPELKTASGFWSPKDNVGVFFDQGTTERMRDLEQLTKELQEAKVKARGTTASKDMAHLANTIELLYKIARDERDIEVVSHEATHQLAGNSGLLPRGKVVLRWAHEGLASYFETATDAGWGGIGAVNEGRLISYYRIAKDAQRRPIEVLVCDALFDGASNNTEAVQAYGQAWAMTHFLMENKFEKLVEYYRRTAEIDPDATEIKRKDLIKIFEEVFGDLRLLDREWRVYMDALKTDVDRLVDALKKEGSSSKR